VTPVLVAPAHEGDGREEVAADLHAVQGLLD
jgi:hypothetical protein